jgi:hypothetical protein
MKSCLLLATFYLLGNFAEASLINRIELEDAVKARVENVVYSYDKNARVLVRLDFKSLGDILPGTSIYANENIIPSQIDSAYIAKANIEVYSEQNNFSNEVKDLIYKTLPIEKSKVSLNFKDLKDALIQGKSLPLDSKTFSDISTSIISDFRNVLAITIFVCALLCIGFLFYQHNSKMNEFKKQMLQLAQAFSENSGGSPMPPAFMNEFAKKAEESKSTEPEKTTIDLNPSALLELFADCYWCKEDAYAHWLWKKLNTETQKHILLNLSFMKDYVKYFVAKPSIAKDYHLHPYYVEPNILQHLSQEQLAVEVKKQWELWHAISPIRQKHLSLTIEEKIKATQAKANESIKPSASKSALRTLEVLPTWGEISINDEQAIFEKPELVPTALKKHVKSLVWLAQKPDEEIKNILVKYDARSIASAWVGPDNVLKKLEAALPEKKSNLVKSYVEKSTASRSSQAYLALVEEGLNEVA